MIREMKDTDLQTVVDILGEAIYEGKSTFRYEVPKTSDFDNDAIKELRYVYEEDGKVLGWILIHRFSSRPAYSGVGEVSIYISKEARGKGVGRALMEKLISECPKFGYWTLTSNIFEVNKASIKLHESMGFRYIGYRERVAKDFFGNWMNVCIYEKRFSD